MSFGCIVAGRPVCFSQQIDANKFVFSLQAAETSRGTGAVNGLGTLWLRVIFLLPNNPLPPGFAAAVHFHWEQDPTRPWRILGMISNEKPSAIFKLSTSAPPKPQAQEMMMDDGGPVGWGGMASQHASANLGVSIEPSHVIEEQLRASGLLSNALVPKSLFDQNMPKVSANEGFLVAQKIGEHLYNFVTSFPSPVVLEFPSVGRVLPFKIFEEWYAVFQRKLSSDPGFLTRASSA